METKIKLNKIELYGYHGLLDNEKNNGQNFEIDVEMSFIQKNNLDNIKNSIDYCNVYEKIKEVFLEKRFNLIESLVDYMGNALMSEFDLLTCKIYIKKPDVIMPGKIESVGIEMNFIN